ncbi:hypothetical protein K8I85_13705 [bacterium]|nr:hypothetical protein [bacterium]
MREKKTLWRPLGAVAMLAGGVAIAYAIGTGIRYRGEPFSGAFTALVMIPAILPAALGYFMMRGKVWAAWTLRISIGGMLLGGVVLDRAGLDVFSLPQLAVPLILGSIAWLVLSAI